MSGTLPKEVAGLIKELIASSVKRRALESAILAALAEAREGALREAAGLCIESMKRQDTATKKAVAATLSVDIKALVAPRPEPAPEGEGCVDPDCRDGWHAIGCPKRPPSPPCTCKMPIGFGRSFRGFMAPDPNCAFCGPAPRTDTEER